MLNPKSTATLLEYKIGTALIKSLELDQFGYKLVAIDAKRVAYLLNYKVSLNTMESIRTIDIGVYHCAFFSNACSVLFTTLSTKVVVFDMVLGEEKTTELGESVLEKCKVIYSKSLNKFIFINKKKCTISLVDVADFRKENSFELKTNDKLRIFDYCDDCKILVAAFRSSVVMAVDVETGRVLEEKTFADADGKPVRIDAMLVLEGFVIVAGSNGVVSLFFKI